MIPADKPSAIAKKRLLKDFVKSAKPLPIPVLNPANVAKANPRYILFNSIILLMFNIAKILISALIIFAASEIGKRDSLLGAIIVSLPMISLITISWLYFETKDVDKIKGKYQFEVLEDGKSSPITFEQFTDVEYASGDKVDIYQSEYKDVKTYFIKQLDQDSNEDTRIEKD